MSHNPQSQSGDLARPRTRSVSTCARAQAVGGAPRSGAARLTESPRNESDSTNERSDPVVANASSASAFSHVELLANHAFLSPHVARRRWSARCYSVLRSERAGNFLMAYNTVKSLPPLGQHESNVDDG